MTQGLELAKHTRRSASLYTRAAGDNPAHRRRIHSMLATIILAFTPIYASAGLFDAWSCHANITFSGYTGSETLTNFPVLVSITNFPHFAYSQFTNASGGDLRFSDASGAVELNYEIDTWNVSGDSYIWVQVPTLTSTTNIQAHWGHPTATAPAYTTDGSTWSAGYVAVYHLSESSGTYADSSAQDNTLTVNNSIQRGSNGCVGLAPRWPDGSDDWLQAPDHDSLEGMGQLTLETWLYDEMNDTSPRALMSKRTTSSSQVSFYFFKYNNRRLYMYVGGTGGEIPATDTGGNTWYHAAATFDKDLGSNRIKGYVDGAYKGAITGPTTVVPITTSALHLGILNALYGNAWKGKLDEARISNVARSADWLKATWMTMASNTAFSAYGVMSQGLRSDAATSISNSSAVLNGTLELCPAETTITVFWGTTDEGTDAGLWEHSHDFDPYSGAVPAAFSYTATGLEADTNWFVRHRGVSSVGTTWSMEPATFITGEISVDATTASAEEETSSNGVFTVWRPAGTTNFSLSVPYEVSGTATPTNDYVVLQGSVTIPAGQTSATINVTPALDFDTEGNETVILTLLSGGAYALGAATQDTVTIIDYVPPSSGKTNIWIGSGNASVATNWSLGHVPASDEHIVLTAFSVESMVWDAGVNGLSDTVASWNQTSYYTGTNVFPITYPAYSTTFTNFVVAGNLSIGAGSWTHPSNSSAQAYRLQVKVGGDLALSSGARIDAQGRGYAKNQYPAGGALGVHGGSRDNYSKVSGSVTCPENIGAAGSSFAGGGAIWLDIAGDASINGVITARPTDPGTQNSIGAGGSVYINAASASGTGTVTVSGNGYYGQSAGSGGRIAVILTEATSLGMDTNKFTARGGCAGSSTGAGTIFVKTADQTYGTLIVDNNRYRSYGCQPPTKYGTTCITAGETWTFDSICIRDYGVLSVPSGTTLVLPNGFPSVSSTNATRKGGILYMGGTMQLGVGTPYTFMSNWIFQADSPYVITGNVLVTDGGALGCIPFRNSTNSASSYAKMDLSVTGNLDVTSTGKIIADNAGVDWPGTPYVNTTQGFHGGQSAENTSDLAYGSVLHPILPGVQSQEGDYATICGGGGVVILTVSGNLNADGTISASGPRGGYAGAAGGSINLTAGTLTGGGTISAKGGVGAKPFLYYHSGGGGRVAIRLTGTGADFGSFGVEDINASGASYVATNSPHHSSAGTVYLQTAAQAEGAGDVIIRNNNTDANTNGLTFFPSKAAGGETDVFSHASLSIEDYATVKLTKSFSMQSAAIETGSKLDLNGYELKLMQFFIGGTEIDSGTYTAPSLGSACVIDSSDPDTGTIIVEGQGAIFFVW